MIGAFLVQKISDANHLSGPLRNESLLQRVIVCGLWFVRFVGFCVSRFVACDLIVTKTRRQYSKYF